MEHTQQPRSNARPAEGATSSHILRPGAAGAANDGFARAAPAVALPKGGGAIRGIDEKFAVNPATGTASLSVPIAVPSGRQGMGPQLALTYDAGAGNGPFGLGWQLATPSITRKTAKGLPRYLDGEDSDTFILSGAEDLVPTLTADGVLWTADREEDGEMYVVRRYRPRTEGLFARIERWQRASDGDLHWRATTRDNVTSIYGQRDDTRIADPDDATRVFQWLIEETRDDKGNIVRYAYEPENREHVDASRPQERNRCETPCAHRYLKRITYGNGTPFQTEDECFEVVFDYGGHDADAPSPVPDAAWPCRQDPFSTYRAGFEIRTYRLCRRVLVFHHFAELGEAPRLVRSTDFTYEEGPVLTYLTAVEQFGYLWDEDAGAYHKESLPPLECTYTRPQIDETVRDVDASSLEHLPVGLSGPYQWVDLNGEGVSGILTEEDGAWRYKRNLGDGQFAPAVPVARRPSLANRQGDRQQILDLAGDGTKDLVLLGGAPSGFFENDEDGHWTTFRPFTSVPQIAWDDPHLRMIDLTGDGHAEVLITEEKAFTWYPSQAEAGFGSAEPVHKGDDEEHGPTLVFADPTRSVYLADMSGDGLTDLVRIRNGDICYWPNRGYGRFGAKVTMDHAPHVDAPDLFDQRRLRLADIDGSGTTDVFYLGRDGVRFWFNQAGNSWSDTQQIDGFPATDSATSVDVVDLLGNGTACLVWSSSLPGDARRPMRYMDLMGGQKPHLLASVTNNMGTETRVQHAASTRFYLDDLAAGTPWITRLPFPVHVVEQVEMRDAVADTKLITRYAYHHGYFDGEEREFRGFGLVEQWDTESCDAFAGAGLFAETPEIADEEFHLPPVYTKTWFHTGAYVDGAHISRQYAEQYYDGDTEAVLLPDTILPDGLSPREQREAVRALRGRMLRQEVYAEDDTPEHIHPYTVAESNYEIKPLQPVQDGHYGVFFVHAREALTYHYERHPDDPRVAHAMTLDVDDFGNVTRTAAIGYPRRVPAHDEQAKTHVTFSESDVINETEQDDGYRVGVPYAARTYELTGLPEPAGVYALEDIRDAAAGATEIAYDADPNLSIIEKRLLGHTRTLYYSDDLSGRLPLGEIQSLALPYESYRMAFTPDLLDTLLDGRADEALLRDEGGYVFEDDAWWIPSGRQIFDAGRFYVPVQVIDPFGQTTTITYDAYALLVEQTEDPLGNVVTAANDYRTLQPTQVTDPNGNRAAVGFDALGLVVATAVMGTDGETDPEQIGDTLDDPTTRLTYDLFAWRDRGEPNYVHTSAREAHGNANVRWQEAYTYFDGTGREAMRKVQAEPGPIPCLGIAEDVSPRWVGTGRTVYDNKGNPVKQYEPFFSTTHAYEDEADLVECGVTPILRYDPLGRLIRIDHPDGTLTRTEFDPWQQTTWDVNDTVLESPWYVDRGSPDPWTDPVPADPDERAAFLAAEHAETPAVQHLDTLGRPFVSIAHNRVVTRDDVGAVTEVQDVHTPTRSVLDIEGNPLAIIDGRGMADAPDPDLLTYAGNTVMRYAYAMGGLPLYSESMDAGARWMLPNVVGNPIRAWDSRGFARRLVYDALQRPTHLFVQPDGAAEILAERTVYGETHPDADALNLRGQVYQVYDGAGAVTSVAFDFKGNLLEGTRRLATEYRTTVDWSALAELTDVDAIAAAAEALLETEAFAQRTAYDALNRPTSLTTPGESEIQPSYNEANLLEQVQVRLRGVSDWTTFVANLDYNARGQRTRIEYGNGVQTAYTYDDRTFRLTSLTTTRDTSGDLQALSYTYDPAGNVTAIRDDAQQTIFFDNVVVEPEAQYTYDALYRLMEATGREHVGQTTWRDHNDPPFLNLPHPNDGQTMHRYTEHYEYDEVGNILAMIHRANGGSWTRHYAYAPDSNRLLATSLPGDDPAGPYSAVYTYDVHGSMTAMPHLAEIQWDVKDQMQQTDLGGGGTVYFAHDAAGQRVRTVHEHNGATVEERIYLGGFELYRKRRGDSLELERETLHVMDDARRIALVETKTYDDGEVTAPTPLLRYQLGNHLESASLEVDEAGRVISYEEYHPYGTTAYHATDASVDVSAKRYRYTGKEKDTTTGLYYHGARYYAGWLGRWTAADPIDVRGGLNLYSYVDNRPTVYLDPTGQYGEAGHYYTVYFASLAAGFDPDVAYKNAFFSQLPDEVFELEAVQEKERQVFPGEGLIPRWLRRKLNPQEKTDDFVRLSSLHRGLHALSGEDSQRETAFRERVLRQEIPGGWEFGLALHAFGDSYSHRELGNESKMYDPGWGHGRHGVKPDEIFRRQNLYREYAEHLYTILEDRAKAAGLTPNLSKQDFLQSIINVATLDTEAKQIEELRSLSNTLLTTMGASATMPDYAPETMGSGPVGHLLTERGVDTNDVVWDEHKKDPLVRQYWPPDIQPHFDVSLDDLIEQGRLWNYAQR